MTPSPYIYPGFSPPVKSVWIIPGYAGAGSNKPMITCIYRHVLLYLKTSNHNFSRRQRDYVMARHWTMFIALCKGYSSSETGSFFQKDHSTVLHAANRIISEISLYPGSRKTFRHFDTEFKFEPKNIGSRRVKQFITTWKSKQLT